MEAPKLLLETLEGLSRRDFNKFKWYLGLKMLKSCRKIPLSHLRSPHPHDTVSKMLESYGEEMAVNIAAAILKKMKHNDTAEELQKAHTEGAAAQKKVSHALPRSSSALALPTDQKTSSDGAAGASTPRPINHTNGSKNITDGAAAQEKVSHALVKSLSALALLGGQTSFTDGEGGGNTPRPINAINGRINFFGGYCGNNSVFGHNNVGINVVCGNGGNACVVSGIGGVITDGNVVENTGNDSGGVFVRNGDVFIEGNVEGDIRGDVSDIIGRNGKVIISGNVYGNVGPIVGCKGDMIISGNVVGNVFGYEGTDGQLIITGNVNGSVFGFSSDKVIISGNVNGNCVTNACSNGEVIISGNVNGDVLTNVSNNCQVIISDNVGGIVEDNVRSLVDSVRAMAIRDAGRHVSLHTNRWTNLPGNKTYFDSDSDSDSDSD